MDRKTELPIVIAFSPEIRTIAMAPAPEGVARATIESVSNIFLCTS